MATASAKKTVKATNGKPASKKKFDLHEALQEHFGFDKFKGNQEKIIENLLAGKDTFVIKPTGGGKSLCYQLPALVSEGVAIIVSPLIALMKNQVDLVRSYSNIDSVAHFLNSTLTKKEIREVHDDPANRQNKNVIRCAGNINQARES
jgi:ATP-dependent DNA helicase RecQ